ncbi:hypothetical protein ACOSQ4_003805 [Xanthoceras sorbifolium]
MGTIFHLSWPHNRERGHHFPSVLGQVTQCKTAIEAWSKLERVYSQQSMAKILQLRQQLQSVKKGADSISDFVLKIKNISDALLGAGEEVNEKDLLLSLMSGVGHEYDPVVLLLTMLLLLTKETTTLEEVIRMLKEEIVPDAEEACMVIDLVRKYIVNFVLNHDIVLYIVTGGLISSFKALTIKETSPHTITTKQPLELVYSDVWGPAPLLSSEGYRYYIIFVDACTRFTWLYPLKLKSDELATFYCISNSCRAAVKQKN